MATSGEGVANGAEGAKFAPVDGLPPCVGLGLVGLPFDLVVLLFPGTVGLDLVVLPFDMVVSPFPFPPFLPFPPTLLSPFPFPSIIPFPPLPPIGLGLGVVPFHLVLLLFPFPPLSPLSCVLFPVFVLFDAPLAPFFAPWVTNTLSDCLW